MKFFSPLIMPKILLCLPFNMLKSGEILLHLLQSLTRCSKHASTNLDIFFSYSPLSWMRFFIYLLNNNNVAFFEMRYA